MKNLRKAAIYWRIRHWWHMPNMWHECVKPSTFWDESVHYRLAWMDKDYRWIARLAVRHTKNLIVRAYRAARWHSRTCCNGNGGGWRTHFCEWLEGQARANEED